MSNLGALLKQHSSIAYKNRLCLGWDEALKQCVKDEKGDNSCGKYCRTRSVDCFGVGQLGQDVRELVATVGNRHREHVRGRFAKVTVRGAAPRAARATPAFVVGCCSGFWLGRAVRAPFNNLPMLANVWPIFAELGPSLSSWSDLGQLRSSLGSPGIPFQGLWRANSGQLGSLCHNRPPQGHRYRSKSSSAVARHRTLWHTRRTSRRA